MLTLAAPVSFTLHGQELADRLDENFGVGFDLEPLYQAGKITRVYLRASWTPEQLPPLPTLATARGAGLLGMDLNADHFAAAGIDASGNPVGAPATIPLVQVGPASLRDARLREAVTALLDLTETLGAGTIVVEDLNFTDPSARERGHGRRMKAFRKTVAGIPTAQVRSRLAAMAARRGITVICVDPRYTSKVGGKAWRPTSTVGGPPRPPQPRAARLRRPTRSRLPPRMS
jgi:IS605 OrfB family transposase